MFVTHKYDSAARLGSAGKVRQNRGRSANATTCSLKWNTARQESSRQKWVTGSAEVQARPPRPLAFMYGAGRLRGLRLGSWGSGPSRYDKTPPVFLFFVWRAGR